MGEAVTIVSFAEACALQAAYCRGIDDRDPALLRSLVTDDVDLVAADGTTVVGRDGFVALFERYWAASAGPGLHLVSNVELLDGGEVRALFHAVSPAAGGVVKTWGRYRDHVARTADGRPVFAAKRILLWGREAR